MRPPVLLLLLAISSLLHALHLSVANTNGTSSEDSCVPARCGDLNITYPFSLGGAQPLDCGFPVFDLTCDGGHAYLSRTFRERLYRVHDIFYGNNSLVAAVETSFAGDEACHVPDFNVSSGLALFPLNISAQNRDLVFVYNCEVPPSAELPRTCANRTMGAYISEDTGTGEPAWRGPRNCSSVSVPVREFHRGGIKPPVRDRYEGLISDGFLLEWPAHADCDACRRSGGECRFVRLTFQCVCPDGRLCPDSSSTSRGDGLAIKMGAGKDYLIIRTNKPDDNGIAILNAKRNLLLPSTNDIRDNYPSVFNHCHKQESQQLFCV